MPSSMQLALLRAPPRGPQGILPAALRPQARAQLTPPLQLPGDARLRKVLGEGVQGDLCKADSGVKAEQARF